MLAFIPSYENIRFLRKVITLKSYLTISNDTRFISYLWNVVRKIMNYDNSQR